MTAVVVVTASLVCVLACAALGVRLRRAHRLVRLILTREAADRGVERAVFLGLVNTAEVPRFRRRSPDVGLVRPAPDTPRVLNDF